jgi:beta-lactamase superfamily II metal-dependent hydrolase
MAAESLSIALLPALEGDCIHIIHTNAAGVRRHVIVDSGPAAFAAGFSNLLTEIKSCGETIDLLCLTHIDNDHIGGAMHAAVHGEIKKELINKILFNITEAAGKMDTENSQTALYSAASATCLVQNLLSSGIPIQKRIVSGMFMQISECKLSVLAPDSDALSELYRIWNMPSEELYAAGRDRSITNASSIAFILEAANRKLALLGDSTPEQLERGLKRCYPAGLNVDAVKLPHHGSQYNINESILNMLHTKCYLISTRKTAGRPDKALIELLYHHHQGSPIKLYGNYPWWENGFYTADEHTRFIESGAIEHILIGKEGIIL